ncbi:MAG TPA: chemotaxis protein CheW [Candidatus Omnitrophota bacterium]|nr:purine-binding chemotaxis protein CheW [Candidatus Omnitrophota bacterium]HPB67954.1 chemotaxis protein CheW [Candidatus Omnitrophota bacterium]HQO58893.1 chemotaxis protein CheW [Candidatus Omnitrophota bacterium]
MNNEHDNTGEDLQSPREYLQFVCFKLAEEEYAVDINLITEVIRVVPFTPVPQVPDFCLGLINCRGTILPLFDLRKKVLLPQKPFNAKSRILIAVIDHEECGLIIDEILDNIRVDLRQVDLTKFLAMKIGKEYIRGVARVEDRMIAILDLQKMHAVVRQELAQTQTST